MQLSFRIRQAADGVIRMNNAVKSPAAPIISRSRGVIGYFSA
jgi:hypothetical protein